MYRNSYKLSLVTTPAVEPVTLNDVKNALRIDHTEDDAFLNALITAARISAESFTKRAFITQTWNMFLNNFPCDSNQIEIPKSPLQSISSIKTYNDSDTESTLASSNYYVSTYSGDIPACGTVTFRNNISLPTVDRVADGVQIAFVAGYGSNATDVPQPIKMAIQEEVLYLYENRGCCDSNDLNSGVAKALLNPFRIINI